jgi:hypothetical protein
MPNPVAAIAGGQVVGGVLQGRSAERAARTSAAAQERAAQMAAEEARFRPVGITTRFGRSMFDTDAEGRVTGAGYEVSPELRAYQDRLMGLTGMGLSQAEAAPGMYQPLMAAAPGLFGLAQGYLAETPQQAAQQYMARQQELLAPSRERQLAQLQNRLFQQGREGLAVGATGARPSGAAGLGAASPEMEAYYNALAQQDAELAARAQQAGMEQTRFGAGLFGTGADLLRAAYQGQIGALAPFEAYIGQTRALENLGQQPLALGIDIGSKGQSGAAARAMLAGGMSAAKSLEAANSFNPFATALTMASSNPAFGRGVSNFFGGGGQAAFSQTGLGQSGFGTGLAYGNQDYGLFI